MLLRMPALSETNPAGAVSDRSDAAPRGLGSGKRASLPRGRLLASRKQSGPNEPLSLRWVQDGSCWATISAMARPIEPTPPLVGADADRLLDELERVAPAEEVARRREAARRFLAQVSTPKSPPSGEQNRPNR
jgi:hypothetical protein